MKLSTDIHKNRSALKGATVAVLGAARSGIAVSRLLVREGSQVLLSDVKTAEELNLDIHEFEALGIELETGGHSDRILESDLICISPGLPLTIPVLVKAAAGGGGKGIRLACSEDELIEVLNLAKQEAEAAFGDGTIYLEPLVQKARHIEVQILADRFGNRSHVRPARP